MAIRFLRGKVLLLSIVLILIGLNFNGWRLPKSERNLSWVERIMSWSLTAPTQAAAQSVALPNLQGGAAIEYLQQQGLYDSLTGAMTGARYMARADAKLPPRMNMADGKLWLETDDREAVYPVTIDPIIAQQAYLKASNTGAGDFFGISLAISGDTIVVAASSEDSNSAGGDGDQTNNSGPQSGAVYVFVRNAGVWSQQTYLKASNPGENDFFGSSVAISGDTIVIGANGEASNATGVNGNQSDNSAPQAGAAYVFVRSGGVWSQQAYLKASNSEGFDLFGISVGVSGDTIVVGARDEDSNATGINGNQNNNLAFSSGAAYVFTRSAGVWSQQAYLKASNADGDDYFGRTVAVSGDTIVVGAYEENSNATGINGNQTNESAIDSGAAYVFNRSAGVWSQQAYLKASNAEAHDRFGWSVAISGETIVVGAHTEDGEQGNNQAFNSGAAYVFTRSAGLWNQQAYLRASNPGEDDVFGYSVALSGDTLVVGAIEEESNSTGVNGNQADNSANSSGAAYVFTRNAGVWSQQAYLKASNAEAQERFGWSVAASGDTVVVGAIDEDSSATGVNGNQADNSADFSGAAYVFTALTANHVSNSLAAADPLICAGPGSLINGTATLTNQGTANLTINGAFALNNLVSTGFCTATVGACTATAGGSAINVTATLAAGQTVTINYQTQISNNAPPNATGCSTLSVSSNNGLPAVTQACVTANCPAAGPGINFPAIAQINGQKPGSVLIYNLYTSATDPTHQNTRLSITNTDPARQAFVHLFFVDGASCSVADSFICLTPNQTAIFLASDLDPGTTGYMVAVATDAAGCPTNFNFLIGDEYVKFQSGHAANLGAEAITAIAGGLPFCNANSSTALLAFDGISYNTVPHALAADNLPSRADGNDTLLILNRIGGNLGIGAATLGPLFGLFYNDAETSVSFTFTPGSCQFRSSISNNFPRLTPRFEQFVPAGRSGWFKVWMPGLFAMTGAVINFNANATASAGAFNQGHNLHVLTNTNTASYILPVFPPGC